MNPGRRLRWDAVLLITGMGLATLAAIIATDGHPGAAIVPVAVLAVLYALWKLPIRTVVLTLILLILAAESPQEKPADGLWHSPLYWLGALLLDNLNHLVGISALAFAGLDVVAGVLLLRILHRRADAWGPLPSYRQPVARAMLGALITYCVTLAALEVWGAARGGVVGFSMWQLRQLTYLPIFGFLLADQLQQYRDYERVARFVVWAALVKAACGFYFYFGKVLPQGLTPEYITTHADAMLFVAAIVIVGSRWLEAPTRRHLSACLAVIPPLALGIYLNDRRIAYVGIAGCAAILFLMNPLSPARQRLVRLGVLALPVLALYFSIGWSSPASFFRPVQSVRTMFDAKNDSSTESRDIENFNLMQTLQERPLFGFGFGHGYIEVVRGPPIEDEFPLYRYIPHNSVLWLLSVGGLIGFMGLWAVFVVGTYLAARVYRHATAPLDRAAALTCLCIVLLYLVQAYGDMGTQSWSTNLLLAGAFVIAGQLSIRVGAWPAPTLQASPALPEKA